MQINFANKTTGKTLDQLKADKIAELNALCQQTIFGNFPYTVNGTIYYFPNDDTAQKNFDKFEIAFKNGYATSPENFTCYDASGKVQRLPFDATSFPGLYVAHLQHIAGNVSLFRDTLEPQVDLATSPDQIKEIVWNSTV